MSPKRLDVTTLRIADHEHGGSVDKKMACLDVGIFPAHLLENLIPEDHGVVQSIGFAHGSEGASFFSGKFIGVTDHPLTAFARKYTVLNNDLVRLVLVQPGTASGIFSLGVLADKDHVDVLTAFPCKRARGAFEEPDRPEVYILIKSMAYLILRAVQGRSPASSHHSSGSIHIPRGIP